MTDGLNCKIKDGKCADRHAGAYGKCRVCEMSTATRQVIVNLPTTDYLLLQSLCAGDDMPLEDVIVALTQQGIKSITRHCSELC